MKLQSVIEWKNTVHLGDCLDIMPQMPSGIADLVVADLPYGVTKNHWDSVIDIQKLWQVYRHIAKPNAAILLFGQDKFSAMLMMSNPEEHRYNLIWEKTTPTGFLNAKKMPLRSHEDILVFYRKLPVYNPQMTTGHERKVSLAKHQIRSKKTSNYGEMDFVSYDSTDRYPTSVLKFATDRQKSKLHPTQKPVALIQYLIKTYTNEGALVVDNVAGSGTTGIACINTGRDYVLIEKDEKEHRSMVRRLARAKHTIFEVATLTDEERSHLNNGPELF